MSITEFYRKDNAWLEIGPPGGTPPPPPPPSPQGIIYGSTIGPANSVSSLITQMNPAFVRVYSNESNTASRTTWASTPAAEVPVSKGVSYTMKPPVAEMQTGHAQYTTQRNRFRTILGGAPANQLVWFGLWHEPWDNMTDGGGSTFSSTQWKNMYINFRADVIDFVNASRGSNPILFNTNLHSIDVPGAPGMHTIGGQPSVNVLLTQPVMDALHEISFDIYNINVLPFLDEWYSIGGQGKRWGIWETGYTVGSGAGNPTDQQVFDRMKEWVEELYPSMTNQFDYVTWFNSANQDGLHNGITNGLNPDAMDYWKALCDACPPATPTEYFG